MASLIWLFAITSKISQKEEPEGCESLRFHHGHWSINVQSIN